MENIEKECPRFKLDNQELSMNQSLRKSTYYLSVLSSNLKFLFNYGSGQKKFKCCNNKEEA